MGIEDPGDNIRVPLPNPMETSGLRGSSENTHSGRSDILGSQIKEICTQTLPYYSSKFPFLQNSENKKSWAPKTSRWAGLEGGEGRVEEKQGGMWFG